MPCTDDCENGRPTGDQSVRRNALTAGFGYVPSKSPPAAPPGGTPAIGMFAAAVIRPFASTVTVGACVALPYVPAVTPVVTSVGLGYVPNRSPPAGPVGVPPPAETPLTEACENGTPRGAQGMRPVTCARRPLTTKRFPAPTTKGGTAPGGANVFVAAITCAWSRFTPAWVWSASANWIGDVVEPMDETFPTSGGLLVGNALFNAESMASSTRRRRCDVRRLRLLGSTSSSPAEVMP